MKMRTIETIQQFIEKKYRFVPGQRNAGLKSYFSVNEVEYYSCSHVCR